MLSVELGFLDWIQANLRSDLLDGLMPVVTALGDGGILWIVTAAVLLLIPKHRKTGAAIAAALVLGAICCNVLLKPLVARVRPCGVNTAVQLLIPRPDDFSFPSGHTCAAFACCVTWARFAARRWVKVLCLVLAALMGLSRLYVGVHFPSDVIAGCAAGCFCAFLAWRSQTRAEELWRRRRA